MCISVSDFNAASPQDTPFNLANISDFNSLIAQSQKFNTRIFALTNAQNEQSGYVLETMIASRDDFALVFNNLAHTVELILGLSPRRSRARPAPPPPPPPPRSAAP
jgi:hypothetical protein